MGQVFIDVVDERQAQQAQVVVAPNAMYGSGVGHGYPQWNAWI
jgi:hypothetical protein